MLFPKPRCPYGTGLGKRWLALEVLTETPIDMPQGAGRAGDAELLRLWVEAGLTLPLRVLLREAIMALDTAGCAR
jgi:hypothetical protein